MSAGAVACSCIPVVETARLRLRAPCAGDFEAVATLLCGERSRFMGGPLDRKTAWQAFAASVGAWILQGFGYWAVEARGSRTLVGAVGLQRPDHFPEVELGWELFDGCEGRGYATEAAAAARDWALGPRGLETIVSYVDPANTRSIRVAERLGAARDPDARGEDPGDLVFRHRRAEGRA